MAICDSWYPSSAFTACASVLLQSRTDALQSPRYHACGAPAWIHGTAAPRQLYFTLSNLHRATCGFACLDWEDQDCQRSSLAPPPFGKLSPGCRIHISVISPPRPTPHNQCEPQYQRGRVKLHVHVYAASRCRTEALSNGPEDSCNSSRTTALKRTHANWASIRGSFVRMKGISKRGFPSKPQLKVAWAQLNVAISSFALPYQWLWGGFHGLRVSKTFTLHCNDKAYQRAIVLTSFQSANEPVGSPQLTGSMRKRGKGYMWNERQLCGRKNLWFQTHLDRYLEVYIMKNWLSSLPLHLYFLPASSVFGPFAFCFACPFVREHGFFLSRLWWLNVG